MGSAKVKKQINKRDTIIKHDGDVMQLVFSSQPDAIQSAINTKKPHQLEMKNLQYLMGILMFIPAPEKILLLGVGAGSLIHFFQHYLPKCKITAVDYDQQLLEFSHQNMMLPEASDNLSYVIQDARQFISECTQHFDLIMVDIFDGSQSPDWTREKEFTLQLKNCLSNEGGVAYNMLIHSEAEFKTFYQLLRHTFSQQTLCLETEEYENLLLYALKNTQQTRTMMQNLEHAQQAQLEYQLPFGEILSVIYDINPVDSGII